MNVEKEIDKLDLTKEQFASVCGVSLRSVQRWVKKGEIPQKTAFYLLSVEKEVKRREEHSQSDNFPSKLKYQVLM